MPNPSCPTCKGLGGYPKCPTCHNANQSGSTDDSMAMDAIEDLLPQHMLACVAHDGEQYLDNEDGMPLITEESCQCGQRLKEYRKLLTNHKKSQKGFYPPNTSRP